jgi:hypothetical protein
MRGFNLRNCIICTVSSLFYCLFIFIFIFIIRSLRRLNISNNFIGPEGLSYFAELLKTNPVLEDCDVRNQLHKNSTTNFVSLVRNLH